MRRKQILLAGRLPMTSERAGRLACAANAFSSGILLIFGYRTINAKSILGYLSLGAMKDRGVILQTDGEDEEEALHAMCLALEDEDFEERRV